MADALVIGLIGCGRQATKHLDGIRNYDPQASMRVADENSEIAREFSEKHHVSIVRSPSDLFDDPNVKCIVICTPSQSHFEFALRALEGGKHVFCEKPLCETVEQARALLRAATKSNKLIQVGYVYRYVPAFRALRRIMLESDAPLGRPVMAIFRIGGRGSQNLWKHRKDLGGGAISEMMVHMVDLAQWLFGRLRPLNWHINEILRPHRIIAGEEIVADAEDFVLASCQTESGVRIIFEADLVTPAFRQFVEVQGERGSFIGSIEPHIPPQLFLFQPAKGYAGGRNPIPFSTENLFCAQMADFLKAVASGTRNDAAGVGDTIHLFDVLEGKACAR